MKNKKRYIPISLPSIGEEEWQAIKEPLMSGWLTQGPKVIEFENKFARRCDVKHAIATTSCTTALHLILTALNITFGDEVIVPAFTWIATANVVLYCDAKPVFVDIDRKTFNLDVNQLESKITKYTKAIIAVHLFGLCADIDAIRSIAGDIPIIEDAACAIGSFYKEHPAGSLGVAGAFSFHPRKIITTGEGGMITTNDDELAKNVKSLRNHGASVSEEQSNIDFKPYIMPDFSMPGFNYRMTDIQAALGLVQLNKLDRFIKERHKWANFYTSELADVKWLQTPAVPEGYHHIWQAYVCYVDESKSPMTRNEIMEYLYSKGINTRPGTHAVHTLKFYAEKFKIKPDDYPAARDCEKYTIAIPLHNRMTSEDYKYVVKIIKSI